jgi:hypothetical protein
MGRDIWGHSSLPHSLDRNAECLGDIVVIDAGAKVIRRFSKIHVYKPIDKLAPVYDYIYRF